MARQAMTFTLAPSIRSAIVGRRRSGQRWQAALRERLAAGPDPLLAAAGARIVDADAVFAHAHLIVKAVGGSPVPHARPDPARRGFERGKNGGANGTRNQ